MNLALLNPFRQADRIDSTLTIPRSLHPPRPKEDNKQKQQQQQQQSSSSADNNKTAAAETTTPGGGATGKKKKKKKKIKSLDDVGTQSGGEAKKKKISSSSTLLSPPAVASVTASGDKDISGGGSINSPFKIPKKSKEDNDDPAKKSSLLSQLSPNKGNNTDGKEDTSATVVATAGTSAMAMDVDKKKPITSKEEEEEEEGALGGQQKTDAAISTTVDVAPTPATAISSSLVKDAVAEPSGNNGNQQPSSSSIMDVDDNPTNTATDGAAASTGGEEGGENVEKKDENDVDDVTMKDATAPSEAIIIPLKKEDDADATMDNANKKEGEGLVAGNEANNNVVPPTVTSTTTTETTTTTTTTTPKPTKKIKDTTMTTPNDTTKEEEKQQQAATPHNNNNDHEETNTNYWTACFVVSFNRRGSYLASGHASGLVPIHDFLGRSLCALYCPPPPIELGKVDTTATTTTAGISSGNIGGGGGGSRGIVGRSNNGSCLLSSFVYGGGDNNNSKKGNTSSTSKNSGKGGKKDKDGGGGSGKKKRGTKSKKDKKITPTKTTTTTAVAPSSSSKKDKAADGEGGGTKLSNNVVISSSDDLLVKSSSSTVVAAAAGVMGGSGSGGATVAESTTTGATTGATTTTTTPTKDTTTINDNEDDTKSQQQEQQQQQQQQKQQLQYLNGVTSLSWDRRSRTLLAGAIGDKNLRLMDNTHPLVATDCTDGVKRQYITSSSSSSGTGGVTTTTPSREQHTISVSEMSTSVEEKKDSVIAMSPPLAATLPAANINHTMGSSSSSSADVVVSSSIRVRLETVSIGQARLLRSKIVPLGDNDNGSGSGGTSSEEKSSHVPTMSKGSLLKPMPPSMEESKSSSSTIMVPTRRHPTLVLELPQQLGGPIELHPRDSHAGLACMINGSLALFYIPPMAYYETLYSSILVGKSNVVSKESLAENERKKWVSNLLQEEELNRVGRLMYLVPPPSTTSGGGGGDDNPEYFITCAAFGKNGETIWAVTKCGHLLAFRVDSSMMDRLRGSSTKDNVALANMRGGVVRPALCVKVPGGAAAWQIKLSRNGKHLLINSADCSLKLYDVDELTEAFDADTPTGSAGKDDNTAMMTESNDDSSKADDIEPTFVFQDNISKAPWASCDFSGDGEYVCCGCNSYPQPGDNYKLFLWNCITGELVDHLTGPVSSLYSLSFHPTRPFIAVGTSDGIIDIWGARLDWVAFAPDFQALQQNQLYEEKEDEFDVVVDSDEDGMQEDGKGGLGLSERSPEDDDVDITTIDKVPAFDSDSEDELDVFHFATKVDKILSEKQPGPKRTDE